MKTFSYSARDADGAIVRGRVEAENRGSALARIAGGNLVALSVTETSSGQQNVWRRRPTIAVAAALVCATATLWLCLSRCGGTPAASAENGAPTASTPRAAHTGERAHVPTANSEDGDAPIQMTAASASSGDEDTPAPPSPEAPATRKRRLISLIPTVLDVEGNEMPLKPAFTSDTEIALSSLISTPPGVEPVNLLPPDGGDGGFEADALSALGRDIVVHESEDTDETARQKEAVAWAKADLAEAVRNGHTARAHIDAIYHQLKEDAELRRDAVAALEEVAKNSGMAEAIRQLEEVNAELKASGQPTIGEEEINARE